MKSLPKISIIIPIYNVEPYIAECLQSVMRQTYNGSIECILVDDCGTDRSVDIVEQLIKDYNIANQKSKIKNPISFRILHHNHNRGLSAARNTGTDAATGDYIYYLDSDDYISDNCMEILTLPLHDYDYDMVVGGMKPFGGNRDGCEPQRDSGPIMSKQAIFEAFYIKKLFWGVAWNRLVKRCLFDSHDLTFLEGQIHEDELWMYKRCLAIESLYIQNSVTYYYRIREDGIMGKRLLNTDKLFQSFYSSIDYVLSHPANISRDIWEKVVWYYMWFYIPRSIQLFKNTWPQYSSIRRRMDYQPLRNWRKGEMTFKELKNQLHYALPPFCGYMYLKYCKLKHVVKDELKRIIK